MRRYITIEREYGSGGTTIARQLSEDMGIPCYGREILDEVSKKYNISVSRIERYEETATNSFMYSIYMMSQATSGNADMVTKEGHMYIEEQSVIREFAGKGSAIFLGHCAGEALKDYPNVINVFIRCTDEKAKRERIMKSYGIPESQVDIIKRKFDKKRANYYYMNTEKKWDDLRNYDLVLDSGKLGIKCCANILRQLLD